MNRAYRLVWSEVTGGFVAVAEFVSARGKRAAAALLCAVAGGVLAAAPAPDALPTGGQPKLGDVSIARSGARMDVVQRSERAIVEWQGFDVGRDAHVHFNQPGPSSVVLNRVLDTQPSRIDGRLSATGQVFLANPYGVYFSPSARVDVGGLVATSARIGNDDFERGRLHFEAAADAGAVVNHGRITAAAGGYVALLAPEVRNRGVVVAELGAVEFAAGAAFDLRFDGDRALSAVRVTPAALAALVDQGGAILAPGGRVVLSAHAANELQGGVVRATGSVAATGLAVGPGGRIVLAASHEVELASARLDVRGETGGTVVVEGRRVELGDATAIDASGRSGGGRVLIGGGRHGADAAVGNADLTRVGRDVLIDAGAVERGDGGEVVIWAERATGFSGRVAARGGRGGGDGGFVEVSAGDRLVFDGHVDAGAAHGAAGRLLLDPKNLVVSNAPPTVGLAGGRLDFATAASATSVINPAAITAVTNTGTAVTLQASNDLSVEANVVTQNAAGVGGDLELLAGRSVTINALINTDGGNVRVVANAPVSAGVLAGERDAGAAQLTSNGIVVAVGGSVDFTLASGAGHAGQSGGISTGTVVADRLTVRHDGPTAGGGIDVGSTSVRSLAVTSTQARDISDSFGDITVQGAPGGSLASFDAGGGNVRLTGFANDFDVLSVRGGSVAVNDLNGIRLGDSTIGGDFALTTHGPIAAVGTVHVAGATAFDAQTPAFGVEAADITLAGGHAFLGPVRIVSARNVKLISVGTLTFGGGTSTLTGTLEASSTTGAIETRSTIDAAQKVTLDAAAGVTLAAPLISGVGVEVSSLGDIVVGAVDAPAIDLAADGNVSGGPLTGGAVKAKAGPTGDVILDDPGNAFESIDVTSGRDARVASAQAVAIERATIGRHLTVGAAGSISAGPLDVGGDARFTVGAAGSDLLLSASANRFGGAVTMATAGAGSFRDVSYSHSGAEASLPVGLPLAGLRDVSFEFAEAPSFVIPAMTILGNLSVSLPKAPEGGGIRQAPGGIGMAADQLATFSTASEADIVLTDPGNRIGRLSVVQGRNADVVAAAALELDALNLAGDLRVRAGGPVTQSAAATVAGSASFAVGGNDLTLAHADNRWNVVRVESARDVRIATKTDLKLGAAAVSGSFRAEVPDALVEGGGASPAALSALDEVIAVQGPAIFRNFSAIDLGDAPNRFGALGIDGLVLPATVRVREDDDITQAAAWVLPGVPVELIADGAHAVVLTRADNQFGDLRIVGGTVSVREADAITQSAGDAGWRTTGTTTLDAQGQDIVLANPNNRLGPLAIAGGGARVDLSEDDDITQAAVWSLGAATVTLDAGSHDIVLDRAGNRLGPLSSRAQNVTVVEDDAITQAAAWIVPGQTRIDAGAHDVTLTDAGNDFATVGVATLGNVLLADANAVDLGAGAVGGRLGVVAGGPVTQSAGLAVGRLDVASTATIRLDRADNVFGRIGDVGATGGVEIVGRGGVEIGGLVKTFGGDVLVRSEGGDLTMAAGGGVEVRGVGNAYLVAGTGFNFVNLNTGGIPSVLVEAGRYLIYTSDKAGTVTGNLSAGAAMGYTFANDPPATVPGTDSRFLYADINLLTITADSVARPYGDANPLFSYTVTGLQTGDTLADALSGAPTLSSAAEAGANAGVYRIDVGVGSLVTHRGYDYILVPGQLTVTPRSLNLSGRRAYDGTRHVDVATLGIGGLVGAERLTLVGTAALPDAEIGADKPLDVGGLALADGSGGAAGNYTLVGGRHRYQVVSALTGLPTTTPLPQFEAPPPRPVSTASHRQLAGHDDVLRQLASVGGPTLLAGDLIPARVLSDVVPQVLPVAVETAAAEPAMPPAAPVAVPTESAPAPAPGFRPAVAAAPGAPATVAPAPAGAESTAGGEPIARAVSMAPVEPIARAEPAAPFVRPRVAVPFAAAGARTVVFGADEAFAHGEARLSAAGRALIDREVVQPILGGYPVGGILITGHTDPTGGAALNQRLSRQRAEAGREYLLRRGVKPALVRAEGRGSSQPVPGLVCPMTDLACLGPERRIEIHLSPKPAGAPIARQ